MHQIEREQAGSKQRHVCDAQTKRWQRAAVRIAHILRTFDVGASACDCLPTVIHLCELDASRTAV